MSRLAAYRTHARAHLALGLPLIGSQLAQVAVQTTDTLMMGWYDVRGLAALVLGTSLYLILFLLISGFAWAVVPLVAEAAEADDEVRIRRVTRMGLWVCLGVGMLAMPIFIWSGPSCGYSVTSLAEIATTPMPASCNLAASRTIRSITAFT